MRLMSGKWDRKISSPPSDFTLSETTSGCKGNKLLLYHSIFPSPTQIHQPHYQPEKGENGLRQKTDSASLPSLLLDRKPQPLHLFLKNFYYAATFSILFASLVTVVVTFAVAYLNGMKVMVQINQYGEAVLELILILLFAPTALIFLFVDFPKYVIWRLKMEEESADKLQYRPEEECTED